MNLQEKIGARHVRLALAVLAGSAMFAGAAVAQEQIQKVEITGSAIKRINVEGALPVQRLTQEAIARSGATTVADLIQALPAMQGFQIEAAAAGTNSGGRVSASLHGIGEEYTLVLLNGRRIAPQGSGSSINLNAIPMSAVERVEILTDGASALYGSDAIAGVLNFILKKNYQGVSAEATYSQPTESGAGRKSNASLTVGFGNLEEDRYNVLLSYRHDEQAQLKSVDRAYAKTAFVPFKFNGTNYIYDRTSTATIPANVNTAFNGGLDPYSFSPYLKQNGKCPAMNFESINNTAAAQNCAFDFVQTVEIVPESKRDSVFAKGTFKATSDINLFAELAYSRLDLTARIAPNTAPFTIAKGSEQYNKYVAPYLSTAQAAALKSASGQYRTYDWGQRASETITDSSNVVVGAEGDIGAWSFNTGLTWSRNEIDERYVGGYVKNAEFRDMLAKNQFDPFAPIGAQSDATKALIAKSIFHGSIRTASTTMKGIDARGSRELFSLPGGKAQMAVGADYRNYHYVQTPDAGTTAGQIYNFNASPAYDLERNNYGAFIELAAPVMKGLELTAAGRYDTFEAVKNAIAKRTMGKEESSSTYKLAARWQPTQTMLFRASYGTGFKAPSMLDIGQPLVNAGFTGRSWACPAALKAENPNYCRPGTAQYNVISGGNEDLKPEKSKQYTVGFRLEPVASFSVSADLWDVKLRDAVDSVNEIQIFSDPVKFRNLFTTYTEPATGDTYWAKKTLSINIGQKHFQGIDWETIYRHRFAFGKLDTTLAGTYMLKADYTEPGTSDKWTSDLNYFGLDNNVVFRHTVRLNLALETGAFVNALTANYKNGYTDAEAVARNTTTGKNETIRLQVPSYMTFDWQGKWNITKAASLRAGVKNLTDKAPPLSLRSNNGHQVGFDPRYADMIGRTFYMTGNYNF